MGVVVFLVLAVTCGLLVRPARRAQIVVAMSAAALAIALWVVAAHDDGETAAFLAAVGGLWLACAVGAAGGSLLAARRARRPLTEVTSP